MKVTAKNGAQYKVVDAIGTPISGVYSFDTETKNASIFIVGRNHAGVTVLALDDKGKPMRVHKKLTGARVIDRKTGEEVK